MPAQAGLLDPRMLWTSTPGALAKLDPRDLWRNPVIFLVEVGAVFTTVLVMVMCVLASAFLAITDQLIHLAIQVILGFGH